MLVHSNKGSTGVVKGTPSHHFIQTMALRSKVHIVIPLQPRTVWVLALSTSIINTTCKASVVTGLCIEIQWMSGTSL